MLVEKTDSFNMIRFLKEYSTSLSKKHVDINVFKTIKSIYDRLIKDVEVDGIHITCHYDEVNDLVNDYISALSIDKNLFIFAKVGFGVPVDSIAYIKEVGDFTYGKVELLPFNQNTTDVEFFITEYTDETLNIDYATKLLVYN